MSKRKQRDADGEASTTADDPSCRICFAGDEDGPLVQPCSCRGTSSWVHSECLAQWRRASSRLDAAYSCGQCKAQYLDSLSVELLQDRLQAQRAEKGDQHQRTIDTMNRLGIVLNEQGRSMEARSLLREALAAKRATLGDRHKETIVAMCNLLSLIVRRLIHHDDVYRHEAKVLCGEALPACREVFGERDSNTLQAMHLQAALLTSSDPEGAIELHRELVRLKRDTLGARDNDTLSTMNNLASLLSKQGDVEGARGLWQEVLSVRRQTIGGRHPDTLTTMSNLAFALKEQNDLSGAVQMKREVLSLKRECLGGEHPDTADEMAVLGMWLKELGESAEALALLREFRRLTTRNTSVLSGIIRELEALVAASATARAAISGLQP